MILKIFILLITFLGFATYVQSQSTSFSVNLTADDYAEEYSSNGYIYSGSSDLELCYDGGHGGQQIVGLHFSSASIPQGVTISSSYLQFTADESQSGTSFTITINLIRYSGFMSHLKTENGYFLTRSQ